MSWNDALDCISYLNESGYEAYIIGGAVRDRLLNRDVHDIDIVTAATSIEIKQLFKKNVQVNTNHQTVLVKYKNTYMEITTFRGESLKEDVKSRDFTINSLAIDPHNNLIDLVGGEADLTLNRLRSLHPKETLAQDPLRMLRAARFVSTLRVETDPLLRVEIKRMSKLLTTIAKERTTNEFQRLLKGPYKAEAFWLLEETKLGESIPGLFLEKEEYKKLKTLPSEKWEDSLRAWLEFAISMESVRFLEQLPLSKKIKTMIVQAYNVYRMRMDKSWTNWELYVAGKDLALLIESVRKSRNVSAISAHEINKFYSQLPIHQRNELAVTGNDLLKGTEREAGPWIRETLSKMERAVVENIIRNEKKALFAFFENTGGGSNES